MTTDTESEQASTFEDPMAGQQLGTESALSTYVGPYVTEMLGRGQALGSMDFQGYTVAHLPLESLRRNKLRFPALQGLRYPQTRWAHLLPEVLPTLALHNNT